MSTRNNYIDVARGVGIILVVLGHSWISLDSHGWVYRVIFSFHMPLFFLLSGLFLKPSAGWSESIRSKADSLLKPYLVILGTIGLAKVGFGSVSPSSFISGLLMANGRVIADISLPPLRVLWFLPALFLASLASLILVKLVSQAKLLWQWLLTASVVALIGFGGATIATMPRLPFSANLLPITAGFMLLGSLVSKPALRLHFNAIHFSAAALAFGMLQWQFKQTIDLNMLMYGSPVICTAQALLGIYLTLALSELMSQQRHIGETLAYVGRAGLFILIFHWLFLAGVFRFGHLSHNLYVNWAASMAAGLAGPIVLLELTKRSAMLSALLLPIKEGQLVASKGLLKSVG